MSNERPEGWQERLVYLPSPAGKPVRVGVALCPKHAAEHPPEFDPHMVPPA
jgi:hypothetical protein